MEDIVFEQVIDGSTFFMRLGQRLIWNFGGKVEAIGWFVHDTNPEGKTYICVMRETRWPRWFATDYPFDWYVYGASYLIGDGKTTFTMQLMAEIEKAMTDAALPITKAEMVLNERVTLSMALEHSGRGFTPFATYWPACVETPEGDVGLWLMIDSKAWCAISLDSSVFHSMPPSDQNLQLLKTMRAFTDKQREQNERQ